jgi:hypothetical protein
MNCAYISQDKEVRSKGKIVPVKAIKAIRGRRGKTPFILNLVVRQIEWSASRPGRFSAGKRSECTHLRRCRVGHRSDLDPLKKIKISRNRVFSIHSMKVYEGVEV